MVFSYRLSWPKPSSSTSVILLRALRLVRCGDVKGTTMSLFPKISLVCTVRPLTPFEDISVRRLRGAKRESFRRRSS